MCRRSGLEKKRRCGWLGMAEDESGPPVWARRGVSLGTCPKSYITADSEGMLESYAVLRRLGGVDVATLPARQVEGFAILEKELAEELKNGRQNTRSIT
jgi:hypothetical protein